MALIYPEYATALSYIPENAAVILCDQSSVHRASKTRIEELGMQLEDCVMVGDNHTDLGAARACNMQSIFCRYGFGAKGNETADYDIEHFAELKEFFQ